MADNENEIRTTAAGQQSAGDAPLPGLYQHYKGPQYEVIDLVRHSETEETLVLYRALYGERGLWVRPLEMFTQTITIDGQTQPRFRRIEQ